MNFAGKTAFVTGGASGIGAATARGFGAAGGAVIVCDVSEQGAAQVVQEIREAGGAAISSHCDVSRAEDVAAAVDAATRAFGGIDFVAACAGVVRHGKAPDFSETDWNFVIDTNLKGVFLTVKHTIPALAKRGGGAIVTVSSVNAVASARMIPAYAASKGGIVSMTRTLALDHASDGIRVNCVLPGSVDTAMLRASASRRSPEDPEAALAEWGRRHPIGHVLSAESVANAILFLASDDASAMTGAIVTVDGGLTALLAL